MARGEIRVGLSCGFFVVRTGGAILSNVLMYMILNMLSVGP